MQPNSKKEDYNKHLSALSALIQEHKKEIRYENRKKAKEKY